MTSAIERIDSTKVRVSVEMKWEDLEKDYVVQLRKVGEGIRIRGFRPGKAPLPLLEKMVGKDVRAETAAEKVTAQIHDLLGREKLFPVRSDLQVREGLEFNERNEVHF